MRISQATGLAVAALLIGTTAGSASDLDEAVRVTTVFYEATARGDCAAALTLVSPAYTPVMQTKGCARLRGARSSS